jgi:SNF2 family DNA or RNA helicase
LKKIKRTKLTDYKFVIINYDKLEAVEEKTKKTGLHAVTWRRIIFDEAQKMQNPETKTYKGAEQLKAKYRWMVSGKSIFWHLYLQEHWCLQKQKL